MLGVGVGYDRSPGLLGPGEHWRGLCLNSSVSPAPSPWWGEGERGRSVNEAQGGPALCCARPGDQGANPHASIGEGPRGSDGGHLDTGHPTLSASPAHLDLTFLVLPDWAALC